MTEIHYRERRFNKDPSVVSRKIGDEFILVPIRQKAGDVESIYTMDEVAGWIWESIDGERRFEDIRDAVVREFEVDSEQAEADLVEFLQQLEEIGAVKEV